MIVWCSLFYIQSILSVPKENCGLKPFFFTLSALMAKANPLFAQCEISISSPIIILTLAGTFAKTNT